jgi:hypothetical protein
MFQLWARGSPDTCLPLYEDHPTGARGSWEAPRRECHNGDHIPENEDCRAAAGAAESRNGECSRRGWQCTRNRGASGSTKAKLGPTVFVPVAVNGVTTKALIDTGSPATIISLDFRQ